MKEAILVVSFGTTYEKTRKLCIESTENEIKDRFKDFEVRRAFTSQMVIERLKKRDGIIIDNVEEALEKICKGGAKDIYIQSLHIIPGHEYEKMHRHIDSFKDKYNFNSISVGKPLLYDEEDYKKVVEALDTKGLKEDEAIVFMGHGTDHISDNCYSRLENEFKKQGFKNVYISTVEGSETIEDIIPLLKENKIRKVILKPFMLVAGDHAKNDMAGDEEDSWKSILLKEGFKVETYVKGLGEEDSIRKLFVSHLEDIME